MAEGSRVCPYCRRLNGIDEKTCYSCGKSLPGPMVSSAQGAVSGFAADGMLATKLIAFTCVVVYALSVASQGGFRLDLSLVGAFRVSTELRYGILYGDLAHEEPWRLLSAVYFHFGVLHIGMNLLSLVSLGRGLETHFGSARFTLLYTLAGIGGFAISQWWTGPMTHTGGASGAIFGLIGAFIGVLFVRRSPTWKRELVNNLVYAAMLGFILPVNNAAHFGGFGVGAVVGALLELEKQPRRHDRIMAVVAGLCMLATVASIALSARSPVWKEVRSREEAARSRANSE